VKLLVVSDYVKWSTLDYVIGALTKRGDKIFCFGPYWYKDKDCPSDISSIISILGVKPDMILSVETHTENTMYPVTGLESTDIPKVFWAIDNHLNFRWHKEYAYVFDKTYFAQKMLIDYAKSYGIRDIEWLPLACEPDIHSDLNMKRDIDVGFVGKLNKKRRILFKTLKNSLKNVKFGIYNGLYGRDMARIYSTSKIVINPSIRKDINMRTFEATGCGALLLNEDVKWLKELFRIGKEIDTYTDVEHLMDKIRFYLRRDGIRERIAEQGKRRSLSEHTYEKRVSHLLAQKFLKTEKQKTRLVLSYSFTLRHRQFKQYAISNRYLIKALRRNPLFTIYYYLRYFYWYMLEKIRKILRKWPY